VAAANEVADRADGRAVQAIDFADLTSGLRARSEEELMPGAPKLPADPYADAAWRMQLARGAIPGGDSRVAAESQNGLLVHISKLGRLALAN
jgi:hypothetical protein